MPILLIRIVLLSALATFLQSACAGEGTDFQSIFDGQTLTGWENPDLSYWSVEEGAITARITREHPCTVNQYLVWAKGELADFELKLESRVTGEGAINSGFQFRSRLLPDHDICGYQVDNNLQTPWLVRLYEEFGRHTLAMRGERALFSPQAVREASKLDEQERPPWFRLEDWHEYNLTCVGPRITLRINQQLAAEVVDNDPRRQAFQGVLGLQLHSGPPSVVQFRNIRLKILKPAEKSVSLPPSNMQQRRKALLDQALAWWPLDAGGHGAKPPLRHVPGWEQFELNRRAQASDAHDAARVVILDGAYFDAGAKLNIPGEGLTVFLRARDPRGRWDGGLFAKRGNHDHVNFNLFSADLPETPGSDIGFEVTTDEGFVMVSFPVSKIEASAWHDLAGRYDGKNLALFCDGQLMASKPCHGRLKANDEPLLIGAETSDGKVVRQFHGELQEAGLWTRALNDEEISVLSHR